MPARCWPRWPPIRKKRPQSGRTLGLSSSTLFFLRGSGHVVSVSKKGVAFALKDGGDTADILLPTGLLFGNAVRDGTGLLDASAFPNSQNCNDLSTELTASSKHPCCRRCANWRSPARKFSSPAARKLEKMMPTSNHSK